MWLREKNQKRTARKRQGRKRDLHFQQTIFTHFRTHTYIVFQNMYTEKQQCYYLNAENSHRETIPTSLVDSLVSLHDRYALPQLLLVCI